eukprot:TRINITY_DN13146_c0_g1_i1.p1 TRINITY_DN13146_c0_g1~~TRINITY_DN13146_c0_g1_i1.p1  ORF type:complete len:407 (+),score=116.21 TRINITY_DN13146_c0_g1_i1:50-1270(+)
MAAGDGGAWLQASRVREGLSRDGALQSRVAALTVAGPKSREMTWQAIGPEKWREWSRATREALESDPRKHWPLGDSLDHPFSPRGGYLPRAAHSPQSRRDCWPCETGPASPTSHNRRGLRIPHARLSLGQTLELIASVYASKEDRAVRHCETGRRQPTLQEHLTEWLDRAALNLKRRQGGDCVGAAGLQGQVMAALRKYKAKHWQMHLFHAILRNEVEEEYRFTVDHLRGAIRDLLQASLSVVHGEEAAQRLVASRAAGRLHEDEWGDLVRYLYTASDAAAVVGRVHDHIAVSAPQRVRRGPVSVRTADDRSIPYSDFEQIVLKYQIEAHASHIRRFANLFRSVDADGDGLLSDSEFVTLVAEIAPGMSQPAVAAVLDSIDAAGTGRITFSECVAFLSKELSEWLS